MTVLRGLGLPLGGMWSGARPQRDRPVRLFDASGREIESTVTDDLGAFSLVLAPGLYRLRGEFAVTVEHAVEVGDQDLSVELICHLR